MDLEVLFKEKRNLFLMGRPGIGKTTIIQKVVNQLHGIKAAGFFTEEIRGQDGTRTGFSVQTLEGKKEMLAQAGLTSSVYVGKYGVNLEVIENTINPVIEDALKSARILIIDEIGKMETASGRFRQLVERALDSDLKVIATIPSYKLSFVDELKKRSDVVIVEVTSGNRDEWPRVIISSLYDFLR